MHKGFILLNCDLGAEEYIVDELKQMSIISNAYLTFGAYDVIAEIETENQEGFEKVVATIRKLSRVVSTMTLNVIIMLLHVITEPIALHVVFLKISLPLML